MDKKEVLKSMLNNLINDKQEEASLDLHSYLTAKMKDVSGIGAQVAPSDFPGDDATVNPEDSTTAE